MSPIPRYAAQATEKRALLVAIEYLNSQDPDASPIPGAVASLRLFHSHLVEFWGYRKEDITILMEDNIDETMTPSKANILRELSHLVADAKSGDVRVFWYAGHSFQIKDVNGDEYDKRDEVLLPADHHGAPTGDDEEPLDPESTDPEVQRKLSGIIVDDELRELLVVPLHRGVRLRAFFDTCTSATLLDLKHNWPQCDYNVKAQGPSEVKQPERPPLSPASKRFVLQRRYTAGPVDGLSAGCTAIFARRRPSLPSSTPKLKKCTLPNRVGVQVRRCTWKLLQLKPRRKLSRFSQPALEEDFKDVISLGSAMDSTVAIAPQGISMTEAFVRVIERTRFQPITWKQAIQGVTAWLRGAAVSSLTKDFKTQSLKLELTGEEIFEGIRDIYRPQLGADSHTVFSQLVDL